MASNLSSPTSLPRPIPHSWTVNAAAQASITFAPHLQILGIVGFGAIICLSPGEKNGPNRGEDGYAMWVSGIWIMAAMAFLFWMMAIDRAERRLPRKPGEGVRNVLSARLGLAICVLAIPALFAVIDSIGQTFYASYAEDSNNVILKAMIAALFGSALFAAGGSSIGYFFKGKVEAQNRRCEFPSICSRAQQSSSFGVP